MFYQMEVWTYDSIDQVVSNKTATFEEYLADLRLILGDYYQLTAKDINTTFSSYLQGLSTEDVEYYLIG